MTTLTGRQQMLLDFIANHLEEHGYPPSIREMGEHMGIRSTNGVNDHLKALEKKGYIERNAASKSRAVALTRAAMPRSAPVDAADLFRVPLVGQVAAGLPVLSEENIEDELVVDRSLLPKSGTLFALRVSGDSMRDAGILDGDVVFVQQRSAARAGEIVVALIEDEATVKTYRPYKDRIVLEPANPDYPPIIIPKAEADQARVLGVVRGVYRKM